MLQAERHFQPFARATFVLVHALHRHLRTAKQRASRCGCVRVRMRVRGSRTDSDEGSGWNGMPWHGHTGFGCQHAQLPSPASP